MITYTTTYPNPDTDGTVCSVVFAEYLRQSKGKIVEAVIKGQFNNETLFVLELFSENTPRKVESCDEADEIFLFDTHHVVQVNGYLDCSKVQGIVDHHIGGNPEAFSKALIVNEKVGAAATILTEQFRDCHYKVPPLHAGLLYAAIISNTLNFTAPTTSQRDKNAANWLAKIIHMPDDLPHGMFEARSAFGSLSTISLLEADCKRFSLGGQDIAISQIEGVGIAELLNRKDLISNVVCLASSLKTEFVLLIAIDIIEKKTTIITANEKVETILSRALGLTFENGKVTVDRILLRKSDFIPALKDYFEKFGKL
jgi:manganese-dependent inorganic pyrophosphatase